MRKGTLTRSVRSEGHGTSLSTNKVVSSDRRP
jgi:hypothetical protein